MTNIKLPSEEEADEILPTKPKARINRVGRRVTLAKAFAAKYLGLTEISIEDLLGLADFIKDSVQKIEATAADEASKDDDEDEMPEIRPDDAFFGVPQCNDPSCRAHSDKTSDDALRIHIANIVKGLRTEMHPLMYAKMIALLEDPRTEIIRTPLGILLRAAAKPQSTPPNGNPGLN